MQLLISVLQPHRRCASDCSKQQGKIARAWRKCF